jgi:hypothetical protein
MILGNCSMISTNFFAFWDRDSRCSSSWPWICDLPHWASWVLELQVCTNTPSLFTDFKKNLNLKSNILRVSRIIEKPFFFFVVLRFELKAYTMNHSTSSFCQDGFFKIGFLELFAKLSSSLDPPNLRFLSSWDYRHDLPAPGSNGILYRVSVYNFQA